MPSKQDEFAQDAQLVGIDPKVLGEVDGYQESKRLDNDRPFGLPLVSGWRSFPASLEPAYHDLVTKVLSIFGSTTGFKICEKKDNGEPEAHIYPFADLHTTIVTFRASLDPAPPSNERAEAIKKFGVDVMKNAIKKESWPKGCNFRFRPKDIVLCKKNAFILWEETTGNLESMRVCLKEEMEAILKSKGDANEFQPGPDLVFFVPNIVHSTFLRFWKSPANPDIVNQIFKDINLLDIFPSEVAVEPNLKVVMEDIPCMHVSEDDAHVLWKED